MSESQYRDEFKNKVTNTTKEMQDAPSKISAPFLELGSQAIYMQEKAGQEELLKSEVLPSDLRGEDELFRALGFVLCESVKDDPLFRYAKLPPGWRKVDSDHDMWSHIVDGNGHKRVDIFYKAAFYDRRAHAHLRGRYSM